MKFLSRSKLRLYDTRKTQPPILANQGLGNEWMAHRPSLPQGNLAVPSALECFTTRFGMGRGGTTPLRARHAYIIRYLCVDC